MVEGFLITKLITNHPSKLREFAEDCLAPTRYLFGGREVKIFNGIKLREEQETPKRDFIKTARAILLLIPGLILGVIAKLFAMLDPKVRNDIITAQASAFNRAQIKLAVEVKQLKDLMVTHDVWKDDAFIQKMDRYMKKSYAQMEFLFRDLDKRAKGDPQKMVQMLEDQCPDPGIPNYCFPYFYDSFTFFYHLARGCAKATEEKNFPGAYSFTWKDLKDEDSDPYFALDTKQAEWRKLYNSFCQKLDPIKDKLKDKRFEQWAQPDTDPKVKLYSFPISPPTQPPIPPDAFN